MKTEKNHNPEGNKPTARHYMEALAEDTGISWHKKSHRKIHENPYGHIIRYDVPGDHPFELWYNGKLVCGTHHLAAAKMIANIMINDQILAAKE